jgi:transposase
MKRFIEGDNRQQITLLPESLDEYIDAENPVRIVDMFVDQLDLGGLGFSVEPAATGRPSYHSSTLLKLYVYGYLNRIQSSRRLERETQRNIELMWLLGRLSPDFKTIADFRRDNGEGIRNACRQFIVLCRQLNLFAQAIVAIDGSKFKAVNAHDRNFTRGKLEKRMQEIDRCIERYLTEMDIRIQRSISLNSPCMATVPHAPGPSDVPVCSESSICQSIPRSGPRDPARNQQCRLHVPALESDEECGDRSQR